MTSTTSSLAANLLMQSDLYRVETDRKLDPAHRSEMGQFLTPSVVAQFMAAMFANRPEALHILDAGAGVGSLTAASIAEVCAKWKPKPQSVTVTAYEVDAVLRSYLRMTLEECATVCKYSGIAFDYEIIPDDFVLASVLALSGQGTLFPVQRKSYNCAILNPPYHKINSRSETRRLLRSIGIETSNLYTAFMWLVIKLLDPGGELVSITPRSFFNGPYFRPFRLAMLESMSVRRVHVFESRKEAFSQDGVLQENVILYAVKSADRTQPVMVSSSIAADDEYITERQVKYDQLVQPNDPDAVLHIVPDEISHQFGQQIRGLGKTLAELGLVVSTGRVVDFRATHLLKTHTDPGVVPLIYPGHFSGGFVVWPSDNVQKPDALASTSQADDLLLPGAIYVLVKRFSSKDERRRVVAAVYDPQRVLAERVGFENHLNYYYDAHGAGLSLDLAKGLAAFLNSTLVDQFFRQFNGHTQVNATDLRSIKYPTEQQLMALGARIGDRFPDQNDLDQKVMEVLGVASEDQGSAVLDPIQAKKRIGEALDILRALKLPRGQLNNRSALTLLALLNIKADTPWREASQQLLGITEMMDYFRTHFGVSYAPNTRETVRRQTIHQFVEIGLALRNPDDPARPTNSPDNRYLIEPSVSRLAQTYGSDEWDKTLQTYLASAESLKRLHAREREMAMIPVTLLDGRTPYLSPGGQNELVKKVVEEFCPRFTPGGAVIYLGDAADKTQTCDWAYLAQLGVTMDRHGKMPDVVIHHKTRDWLVLIEAVTSHGPVDIKRHNELKELFKGSKSPLVFVTAFKTRQAMIKYLRDIAWETEVWVAESPTHMIHFNGERFLGPYEE